jgi:uncharacterized protein YdaU (DUF1376 family)
VVIVQGGDLMGRLRWYKRDPRAALTGMRKLTLEERGAYNTILELIYINDGALEDDSRVICGELCCNARRWRRLKARLLELGKIYVHAGTLRNERADDEVRNAQSLVKLSELKANKRWALHNEIKRLRDAAAMQPTTTKKDYLSAKIVPLAKGPPDKKA